MPSELISLKFVSLVGGEGVPEDVAAKGGEFYVGHFADNAAETADVFRVGHELDEYVHNG